MASSSRRSCRSSGRGAAAAAARAAGRRRASARSPPSSSTPCLFFLDRSDGFSRQRAALVKLLQAAHAEERCPLALLPLLWTADRETGDLDLPPLLREGARPRAAARRADGGGARARRRARLVDGRPRVLVLRDCKASFAEVLEQFEVPAEAAVGAAVAMMARTAVRYPPAPPARVAPARAAAELPPFSPHTPPPRPPSAPRRPLTPSPPLLPSQLDDSLSLYGAFSTAVSERYLEFDAKLDADGARAVNPRAMPHPPRAPPPPPASPPPPPAPSTSPSPPHRHPLHPPLPRRSPRGTSTPSLTRSHRAPRPSTGLPSSPTTSTSADLDAAPAEGLALIVAVYRKATRQPLPSSALLGEWRHAGSQLALLTHALGGGADVAWDGGGRSPTRPRVHAQARAGVLAQPRPHRRAAPVVVEGHASACQLLFNEPAQAVPRLMLVALLQARAGATPHTSSPPALPRPPRPSPLPLFLRSSPSPPPPPPPQMAPAGSPPRPPSSATSSSSSSRCSSPPMRRAPPPSSRGSGSSSRRRWCARWRCSTSRSRRASADPRPVQGARRVGDDPRRPRRLALRPRPRDGGAAEGADQPRGVAQEEHQGLDPDERVRQELQRLPPREDPQEAKGVRRLGQRALGRGVGDLLPLPPRRRRPPRRAHRGDLAALHRLRPGEAEAARALQRARRQRPVAAGGVGARAVARARAGAGAGGGRGVGGGGRARRRDAAGDAGRAGGAVRVGHRGGGELALPEDL